MNTMKKVLFGLMLIGTMTLGACATTPSTDTSTKIQEFRNTINKARLAVATAQAVLVVIPTCVVDKPQVCLSEQTKTKLAGYAALAQSGLATASSLLSTNVSDPATIAVAISEALKAVNEFVDAVNNTTGK